MLTHIHPLQVAMFAWQNGWITHQEFMKIVNRYAKESR